MRQGIPETEVREGIIDTRGANGRLIREPQFRNTDPIRETIKTDTTYIMIRKRKLN